jgi:hypothetical protein
MNEKIKKPTHGDIVRCINDNKFYIFLNEKWELVPKKQLKDLLHGI